MSDTPHSPAPVSRTEAWDGNDATSRYPHLCGPDARVSSGGYGHQGGGRGVYRVCSGTAGRITRMLLADVSGHGPAVSAPAGLARNHVKQVDQRRLVRALNSAFAKSARSDLLATAGDEERRPGLKQYPAAAGRTLRAMGSPGEPVPWSDLHPANPGVEPGSGEEQGR